MLMPKPTEIVDFLLARVEGLDRRDLEARLKGMRAAGLWPSARRVADREAEAVTARHCANLILGLLGSNTATSATVAAKAFSDLPSDLPVGATAEIVGTAFVSLLETNEKPTTLGEFLERAIKLSRANKRPWPSNVEIGELVAHHGDPCSAFLYFRETDSSRETVKNESQRMGYVVQFGNPQPADPAVRLYEHRSIHCHIVHVMAEFLGPLEDADEEDASE